MPKLTNNNFSNQIYSQNQLLWDLGMPGKDMDNPQVNLVIKSPNLFHFYFTFTCISLFTAGSEDKDTAAGHPV